MSIRAVLFDLGNTLIEFEPRPLATLEAEALAAVWAELDRLLPAPRPGRDAYLAAFRAVWRELEAACDPPLRQPTVLAALAVTARRLGLPREAALLRRLEAAHYKAFRRVLVPYPDALPVLRTLRGRGLYTAVVSNTVWSPRFHEEDLVRFGLRPWLGRTVYSSALGRRKPHPEPFLAALADTGIPPTAAVVVGDRPPLDVLGARRVGARAVLKRHPLATPPAADPPPDAEITTLGELPGLLADGL